MKKFLSLAIVLAVLAGGFQTYSHESFIEYLPNDLPYEV